MTLSLSIDAQSIVDESPYKEELMEVIRYCKALLGKEAITPTELQMTILINHLNEMLKRSYASEKMAEVDPEMFAEVSAEALMIADQIVQKIGNLAEAEKYVLSIHFEAAKQN